MIDATELGRRIRNARVAAGRTQSDLAAGEVTAAYVSRIEAGQRKPEFLLLGRMAQRANTSLEALLADSSADADLQVRVALDYAELALVSGEASKALVAVASILDEFANASSPDPLLVRDARRLKAHALEATGDLDGAIALLEELVEPPQADPGWLRCLISLSRCYRECGEIDRAIAVGEQAQTSIEALGLSGLTEAIQLSLTVSGAYVVRGELNHAMRLCKAAIDAADAHDSPTARASAYWNASIIESDRGEHGAALELARLALTSFESGEDVRNVARLRIQVAIIQLRVDPPDPRGALETLSKAGRELAWSAASPVDRAREALTRAQAHGLLGESDQAREALAECERVRPPSAVVLSASALALGAQIELNAGDTDRARSLTMLAVQTLTGIGADRDAAQLWFELGGTLEVIGEGSLALDAYRRAAASTGLQLTSMSVSPTSADPGR